MAGDATKKIRNGNADDSKVASREDTTLVAIETLRTMIIAGKLMPNEHLVEADLAAMLAVNRANIRTALIVLEAEGLVKRELNRGARVRLLTEKEAIEIDEIRIVLEIDAVRRAAVNASEADNHRLLAIVSEMEANFAKADYVGAASLNSALHGEIVAIADNATLTKIIAGLRYQLIRHQFRKIIVPEKLRISIAQHREIAESIVARDPDRAERAMRHHLETVLQNLKELIVQP